MSLNLPLTTAAERAAALRALTTFVNALDGATTSFIAGADNPETGIVTPSVVASALSPAPITAEPVTAAEVFTGGIAAPVTGLVGGAISLSPPGMAFVSAPPAPVLDAVEVDVNGEIWSADKHSSTKTKNKDGSWRVKRNTGAVDDAPAVPPAPPVVAAVPPAPPVTAAPVAAGSPTTLQELLKLIMPLTQAGKITSADVTAACQAVDPKITALPVLSTNPALIPQVWQMLQLTHGV